MAGALNFASLTSGFGIEACDDFQAVPLGIGRRSCILAELRRVNCHLHEPELHLNSAGNRSIFFTFPLKSAHGKTANFHGDRVT